MAVQCHSVSPISPEFTRLGIQSFPSFQTGSWPKSQGYRSCQRALGALQQHMGEKAQEMLDKIGALQSAIGNLDADGEKLSAKTQSELSASIGTLESSILSAFATMEAGAREGRVRIFCFIWKVPMSKASAN